MKKLLAFVIVSLVLSVKIFAQDIINFNNGSQQTAQILEVRTNEIVYKLTNNMNGPVYTMNKNEINSIQYANGYREVYGLNQQQVYSAPQTVYVNPQPVQVVRPVITPSIGVVIGGGNWGVGCGPNIYVNRGHYGPVWGGHHHHHHHGRW